MGTYMIGNDGPFDDGETDDVAEKEEAAEEQIKAGEGVKSDD